MRLFTAIIALLWATCVYAQSPTQVLWGNQAGSPPSIVFKSGSSWIPIGTYNGTTFSPVLPRLAAQSVDCNPTGAIATAVSCTTLPTGLTIPAAHYGSGSDVTSQLIMAGRPNVFQCMSSAQIIDALAGTRTLDLTSTLQTCMTNAGTGVLLWPAATYYLASGNLTVPAGQFEVGATVANNNGSIIQIGALVNAPIFNVSNNSSGVIGMALRGYSDATTTNQHCIAVHGVNIVTIESNQFSGCYDGLYVDGSSFYLSVSKNLFYNNYAYDIYTNSTTTPGVDLFLTSNRFLGGTTTLTSVIRFNGLGSLESNNNQISTNETSGPLVWFENPALGFGGVLSTNDVFENAGAMIQPAVYIQGAATASGSYRGPWNLMVFTNPVMNGGYGNALKLAYAEDVRIMNGTLASSGASPSDDGCLGIVFQGTGGLTRSLNLIGTRFDHNFSGCSSPGSVPLVTAQAGSTFGVTIADSFYTGSNPFLDLSALAYTSIFNVDVSGSVGSNATPIRLPANSSYIPGGFIGTKATVTNSSDNAFFAAGQDATHYLNLFWAYNATAGNAYGAVGTYNGNNPLVLGPSGETVQIGLPASHQGSLLLAGSTSGATTLAAPTTGGGTMTLQAGTGTLATTANIGAVSITPYFGATCNDAAWAAADASDRTIVIPKGTTCTLSNDYTQTTQTPWIVEEGAAISVASTKTLTFSGGAQLQAGYYQIFTGAGTVRGLAFPKPNWWGVSDQAASVQAAHDSAEYAAQNHATNTPLNVKYGVDLGCGFYTFSRTVNLRPTVWFPLDFNGCSPDAGGARIIAANTFTGSALIDLIAPTSGSGNEIAQFNIGNFQLINNASYSVTSGLRIGKDGGTTFNPTQANPVHDIHAENFARGIDWQNGRLFRFERIGISSITTGSACVYIHPTSTSGSFVGDGDFVQMNCAPCHSQLLSACTGSSNITIIGDAAGTGVAGLRFTDWVGYHSRKNISIAASNGGAVTDIWVKEGSQFDGTTESGSVVNGVIVEASAVDSGTVLQNINIGAIYSRGTTTTYSTYAYNFYSDGTALANSLNINKAWLANSSSSGVWIHNVSGSDVDMILDSSGYNTQTAVVVDGASSDVTLRLNAQSCTAPYVYAFGVLVQDTATRVKAGPSVISNCATILGGISSSGAEIDLSGLYPKNTANGPAVFDSNGLATMLGFAIGSLPTCNAGNIGKLAYVTDANAPTYGATLSAGGAVKTLAWCDGSNWTAH